MSERPRIHLIDGYSTIFRAYYAIRGLSNTLGEPTNAVFGFLQILRKLLRDENPQYLGVALDVSRDTVRTDRYAEYKANRAPMPEDLRPQVPWIRKILTAYKIPLLEMPKYEADDVLGTLAKKGEAAGFEVILLSADKDLFQLVGDGVRMYHTGRDKIYNAALVEEDFGVPPEKVTDVLALMGDSVDNVPGVPGIGEKGAKKLVNEYGSLDELLEKAGEIKRKSYREGLQNHRDDALMSKELVTIHTDLPIELDLEALAHDADQADHQQLLEIFWELDFRQLAEEIESNHGVASVEVSPATPVTSAQEWQELTARLSQSIHVGAVGDDSTEARLGLAVLDGEQAFYADFAREDVAAAARASLAEWLADENVTLIGHDLKEVLRLAGVYRASCRLFDTMLASYLLMTELRSHAFGEVVHARLRRRAMTPKEAGFSRGNVPGAGDPLLLTYAAERVVLPQQLATELEKDLATDDLREVYRTIEEPLLPILVDMEERGVHLDREYLAAMSSEMTVEVAAVEEKIYEIAGEKFNINSPKQLGEIMFEKLGYPVLGKTRKTKSYSTGAETLEELAARKFPLPQKIIDYREITKLQSTYVDALPEMVNDDGRLHTRFNQAVASTGRLSSAHPNLQNIPIRTDMGHRIRKAFRAAPGHALIVADYSQVELRVLAHIAQEKAMIEAFQAGEDIHARTAAAVFDVAPLLVNPDQRRMAKVINFGIIYGMSAFGLARNLGISRKEAEGFIQAYMERYPGVKRYTEETLEEARDQRKVFTLYGRSRTIPDIRSRNWNLRSNAERMAINARIQGTAADLLKLAMIAVDRRLVDTPGRLLLTVHDELVLEAPEAEAATLASSVREEMENVAKLDVPLVVDVATGPTWFDAKE